MRHIKKLDLNENKTFNDNDFDEYFELNERKGRNRKKNKNKGDENPIYASNTNKTEKDDTEKYEDYWKKYLDKKDKEEEEFEKSRKDMVFRSDSLKDKNFKDMNILERFIELTKLTYILGQEDELEYILPEGYIQDSVGNYYIKIGESNTMFTCHLDTATSKKVKVNHVVEGEDDPEKQVFVSTDGQTILGADDKSGTIVMLHMIENNIPGLYYFFIGEEKGTVGSSGILKANPEFFKDYKKCISFDRRGYGSVITKQFSTTCCSNQFAAKLVEELGKACGTTFKEDPTGVYTDSAVFMDDIPECTNISVGYFNEHTHHEHQNITYLEWLCKGVLKVDWENLPVERDPDEVYYRQSSYAFSGGKSNKASKKVSKEFQQAFDIVEELMMQLFEMECLNAFQFEPEKEMLFETWDGETTMSIFIHNDLSISIGKDHFVDMEDLEHKVKEYYNYDLSKIYDYYADEYYEDDLDNYSKFLNRNTQKIIDGLEEEDEEEVNGNVYNEDGEEPFDKDLDVDAFMKDVKVRLLNGKKMGSIPAGNMGGLLNEYDKSVGSLIIWLYHNGNDPRKTGGLMWDDDYDEFYFEQ